MSDDSTIKSKRIVKNTIVLYVRMIFLTIVTLYTSRVFLDALGVDDYGIYNVVGGFVSMFALISSALTGACSRYLNFEMGKSDSSRQAIVFSTALFIQILLVLIIILLAEVVGIWYVNNVMIIPHDRLDAANWCFQISLITFCLELLSVPYNATIIAHEKMTAYAYISIYEGLAKLVVTFLIFLNPFDRLIYYAILLCLIKFSVIFIYTCYCKRNFSECRFNLNYDKSLIKSMLSYSFWHLLGNGSVVLKTHGVNVLINLFYGPSVNAARALASQVDGAVNQFAGNFMMAMNPQITQSYSNGNYSFMFNLINRGARFSFYLMLLVSLPLLLNTSYILSLWLKEVPDYTIIFAQIAIIAAMITSLSRPLITAQNATGNVKTYQLVIGSIQLLNLPLCYLGLILFSRPEVVVVVALIIEFIALFARVYMIPKTIPDFNPSHFITSVCLRCFFIAISALPICIFITNLIESTFLGLIVNVVLEVIVISLMILYMGCDKYERELLLTKILKLKKYEAPMT